MTTVLMSSHTKFDSECISMLVKRKFMLLVFQSCRALMPGCGLVGVYLLLSLSLTHVAEFGNFQESGRTKVNIIRYTSSHKEQLPP